MRRYSLLVSLCIVIFLVNVKITAINLTLTNIAYFFHLPLSAVTWALNSYLLTFSVFMLVGGFLSDVLGQRTVILSGLSLFSLSSICAGISPHFSMMVVARAVQGVGAAFMLPAATASFYSLFSENRKGVAMGTVSATVGLGVSIGPLIGGLVVHYYQWQWVFWSDLPLCLLAFIFLFLLLPKKKKPAHNEQKKAVDLLLFITPWLLWGIASFNGSLLICTLLCIPNFIMLIIFLKRNKKSRNPILALHLLNNRAFQEASIIRFLTSFAYFNLMFLLAIFSEQSLDINPAQAGFLYLPMTICATVFSPIAGKLYDNGKLLFIKLDTALFSFSILLGLLGLVGHSLFIVCILLSVLGLIYGFIYSIAFKVGLSAVCKNHTGKATSVFYLTNTLGSIAGVSYSALWIKHSGVTTMTSTMITHIFLSFVLIIGAILLFNKARHWAHA